MSTITDPRPTAADREADQRLLVRGIGWKAYDAMAEALSDSRQPRMTYDQGNLEFMSPSPEHEVLNAYLRVVIEIAAEYFEVPIKGLGQTTFRSEDLQKGLEPDSCFYTVNWRRMVRKKRLDMRVDPAPDLAIEIDITSSSINRLGIYAALRVPEIWRCDGESVQVLLLQPSGEYRPSDSSPTFPRLPIGRVLSFGEGNEELDDLSWKNAFRRWLDENARPAEDAVRPDV
jgi:Uma2 family endonuclease